MVVPLEGKEGMDGRDRGGVGTGQQHLATAGQGYKEKADAQHGIELVQKSGTDDKLKYEFTEDTKKEHRWHLKAANGQIVAASSEGYKAKADAEKAVAHIKAAAAKTEVVDVKE